MPPTKVSLDNLDIIAEEISKLLSHPKSHDQHRWIVALAGTYRYCYHSWQAFKDMKKNCIS